METPPKRIDLGTLFYLGASHIHIVNVLVTQVRKSCKGETSTKEREVKMVQSDVLRGCYVAAAECHRCVINDRGTGEDMAILNREAWPW